MLAMARSYPSSTVATIVISSMAIGFFIGCAATLVGVAATRDVSVRQNGHVCYQD